MISQCKQCEKIKRFGEWIRVPVDFVGIFTDLKKTGQVTETICPACDSRKAA